MHQTPPDTTRHAPDTTRHYQTCTRHHQTLPDMHRTMSDRLAVVLWWFIELYSWSRFFAPTDGRTDELTKVFQEVLADLKSFLWGIARMRGGGPYEGSWQPLSSDTWVRLRSTKNASSFQMFRCSAVQKCAEDTLPLWLLSTVSSSAATAARCLQPTIE